MASSKCAAVKSSSSVCSIALHRPNARVGSSPSEEVTGVIWVSCKQRLSSSFCTPDSSSFFFQRTISSASRSPTPPSITPMSAEKIGFPRGITGSNCRVFSLTYGTETGALGRDTCSVSQCEYPRITSPAAFRVASRISRVSRTHPCVGTSLTGVSTAFGSCFSHQCRRL